jgi:hypothetical protein
MPFGARMVWVAAALALCGSCGAALAAGSSKLDLTGTWSGTTGGAVRGTFLLQWRQSGSTLHGIIAVSNRQGTYKVSGSVHRKTIRFRAVGTGVTYTGSATVAKMSGRYTSPHGSGTWSAHRCKPRTLC